jgi:hypothetical protein
MALSSQFDNLRIGSPALPYSKQAAELDTRPHIVDGHNMLATPGGKLIKRPGWSAIANSTSSARADRLVLYKTLETTPKVYVLASFYNGSTWSVQYWREGAAGWVSIPNLRNVNTSERPHEIIVSRGLAFIKGFPGSSGDKYGTVIFDGRDATTTYWGLVPPTTAARLSGLYSTLTAGISESAVSLTVAADPGFPASGTVSVGNEDISYTAKAGTTLTGLTRGVNGTTASAHSQGAEVLYKNWTASSHTLTVDIGWNYVYAYKSKTGQVSCRSPLESNPDYRPSDSGGFSSLRPKLDYVGQADTTNIPKLIFFRTTDGGSGLYKLEEFANPGSGTQVYTDDSLAGTTGALDPLPDELLDTNYPAPSLVSNLPPPTVNAPLVQGTDTVAASSPLDFFAGRLWYWIGNELFYSANEEVVEGVPEESWPLSNKFRARNQGVSVKATREALYAFTDSDLYWVRGTDKESLKSGFSLLAQGYGMASDHPRAVTTVGDQIAWLTPNYEVAITRGEETPNILSDHLKNDLVTLIAAGAELEFQSFSKRDKKYLIVNCINKTTLASTRQYVYDFSLGLWNTPWRMSISACVVGRYLETNKQTYLVVYQYNGSSGSLAYWDDSESVIQDGGVNYDCAVTFGLTENPAGNHLNERSVPSHTTVLHGILIERTKFTSDTEPTVEYYKDDAWTTPLTPATALDPPRRGASAGYSTKIYPVSEAAQRVAVKISKTAVNERFELQTVDYIFQPGAGS